jgi:Fe-S cluster biogenesis protein NfuA
MFIQTETTPNPSTLKFLPGKTVMSKGTANFTDETEAQKSPLANALFMVKGVQSVFFGSDFISVTKSDGEWQHLKPAVLGAIMEHFTSASPLFADEDEQDHEAGEEFFEPEDAQTVMGIKELLETRIRPAVAGDGGDIVFKGYRQGIVYLTMKGACSGCPSSTATLKNGIQNLLRHYLPEVVSVEQM